MQNLLVQLRRVFSRFSAQQKVAMVLVGVLFVVALVLLSSYLGRPNYRLLYSGLDGMDAANVTAKLDELGISNEVQGSSVMVPAGEVDEARIKLAGAGLPAGGSVGFEIFDKSSFGESDFTRQINYQRALEGELARTITALDPVQSTLVHLALPQGDIFTSEEKPVTASVMVKLGAGRQLESQQVESVQGMVAGAVSGLKPGDVTVSDSAGNVLSGGDSPSAMTSEQLRALSAYESSMETSLQPIINRVVGPDKGMVKVRAELDFTSRQGQMETFTAPQEGGLPRETHLRQEVYGGEEGAAGGIPGTTGNIPDYTTIIEGVDGAVYQNLDGTTLYDNNRLVEEVRTPPGQVLRLSTAVLLDKSVDRGVVAPLENALEAAVGLDVERGDVLMVELVDFDTEYAEDAEEAIAAAASREQLWNMIKTGALALLALLAAFLLWRRLRKVKARLAEMPAMQALPEGDPNALGEVMAKAKPLLEGGVKTPVLASLEMLANQRPDELANLLQSMMKERD